MLNSSPIAYNRIVAAAGGIPIVDYTDYTVLRNKPSIEGVTLNGNKTFVQLGLIPLTQAEISQIVGLTSTNVVTVYGSVIDVYVNGLSVVDTSDNIAKINLSGFVTTSAMNTAIATAVQGKQDTLTQGSNIQISGNIISAIDTVYDDTEIIADISALENSVEALSDALDDKQDLLSDFVGATTTTDGETGLVPAPIMGSTDRFLCCDGTWKTVSGGGGTTVVANPTGTATDTLNTIQIGSTIYDIQGGGGGGSTVTIDPKFTDGIKIADYTIGTDADSLYLPASITPVSMTSVSNYTKIADFTLGSTTSALYTPTVKFTEASGLENTLTSGWLYFGGTSYAISSCVKAVNRWTSAQSNNANIALIKAMTCLPVSTSTSNRPSGESSGGLLHLGAWTNNTAGQLYISSATNTQAYIRGETANTWGSWYKLLKYYTSGSTMPASKLLASTADGTAVETLNVTTTEANNLSGSTSNIQGQINAIRSKSGGSTNQYTRTQLFSGGTWTTPNLVMQLSDVITNYDELEFVCVDKAGYFRNSAFYNAQYFKNEFPYNSSIDPTTATGDQSHKNALLSPFSSEYIRLLMGSDDSKIVAYQATSCFIGEIYGIKYNTQSPRVVSGYSRTELFSGGTWATATGVKTLTDNITNYDELEFIVLDSTAYWKTSYKFDAKYFKNNFPYLANPTTSDQHALISIYGTFRIRMVMGDADNKINVFDTASTFIQAIYGVKYSSDAATTYVGDDTPTASQGNVGDRFIQLSPSSVATSYNYIRFDILENKTSARETQLSKIEFTDGTNVMSWSGASVIAVTCPTDAGAANIIDGSVDTKLCSIYNNPRFNVPLSVTIQLTTALDITTYNKFRWYTANDLHFRDPRSFRVMGSTDGVTWSCLLYETGFIATESRKTLAYTGDIANIQAPIKKWVKITDTTWIEDI